MSNFRQNLKYYTSIFPLNATCDSLDGMRIHIDDIDEWDALPICN